MNHLSSIFIAVIFTYWLSNTCDFRITDWTWKTDATDSERQPEDNHFSTVYQELSNTRPQADTLARLISPLELQGHQRLVELGLRSWEYSKHFSVWKKLHLISCGNNSCIRDDIHHVIRNGNIETAVKMQLANTYDEYRYFMSHFSHALFPWTSPYFPDHLDLLLHGSSGQGIVFTASDIYILPLIVAIRNLRRLGCTLPIEVMYFGDKDLSAQSRGLLIDLPGVVARDMSFMIHNTEFNLGGWSLKPFAMLLTSFREVILMDADAYMFRDPTCLFEEPGYRRTGALFFYDRVMRQKTDRRKWLQQVLETPTDSIVHNRLWNGRSSHMQESGVVVVDRWKHLVALLLSCQLNGPEYANEHLQFIWGDKETYWLAKEMLGEPDYAFHEGGVAAMGSVSRKLATKNNDERLEICAKQLIHLDRANRPLWFNGGLHAFNDNPGQETISGFDVNTSFITEDGCIDTGSGCWRQHELQMYWCISSRAQRELSPEENETLRFLRHAAREVGMHEAELSTKE